LNLINEKNTDSLVSIFYYVTKLKGTDSGYVLNTDFFRGPILAGVERK
jgi:hypothetical protein